VPDELGSTFRLLKEGEACAAIVECERLAALGSNSARALIAYLHLCGAIDGQVNLATAETFAGDASSSGCAYAQYVLAWIYFKQGNRKAAPLMSRAAVQGNFLPAQLELGRWAQGGPGSVVRELGAAEDAYRLAHRRGHVCALLCLAALYARGLRGFPKQVLGIVIWPFAFGRLVWQMLRNPFVIHVFLFVPTRPLPMFVRKHVRLDRRRSEVP
jgi:TPR repeat protein